MELEDAIAFLKEPYEVKRIQELVWRIDAQLKLDGQFGPMTGESLGKFVESGATHDNEVVACLVENVWAVQAMVRRFYDCPLNGTFGAKTGWMLGYAVANKLI